VSLDLESIFQFVVNSKVNPLMSPLRPQVTGDEDSGAITGTLSAVDTDGLTRDPTTMANSVDIDPDTLGDQKVWPQSGRISGIILERICRKE
jgi:hypothetical protein